MTSPRTALIVAPFWRQAGHVGVYRVDRFVRWLSAAGVRVVVVRGGSADGATDAPWGVEVVVRDPLGLYRDGVGGGAAPPARRPNPLRRQIAHVLLPPDPTIVWALRAARHPLVRRLCPSPSWVISSSPPESSHVAATMLAQHLGGSLVVDLRDGWLDEPLRSVLRRPGLRRALEARLEARTLRRASVVFVTSPVWRTLLARRLPWASDRTVVLTNGYPPHPMPARSGDGDGVDGLELLHAGRFAGSRAGQSAGALLATLWSGLARGTHGRVTLLGALEADDLREVAEWRTQFEAAGWQLAVESPVPREELFRRYARADGLLLLSASPAAVPSKLFEYLPAGRPVLAVTPEGSAVRQLTSDVPQVFSTTGASSPDAPSVVRRFLSASARPEAEHLAPPEFGEPALATRFLGALGV